MRLGLVAFPSNLNAGILLARKRSGCESVVPRKFWSLVPALGVLLLQIILRGRRRRRGNGRTPMARPEWPGLDSEFYDVEGRLLARGLGRQAGEPLSTWLVRTSAEPAVKEIQQPLQELLQLHYRYRFDPEGLSRPERQRLRRQAQECLAAISTRGS